MMTRMIRVLITWSVKSNKRLQFFREFQIMIFPNSPLIRLGNTNLTLLDIVSKLISGGVVNKQSVSLAQSIQQHVNKQWNQTTSGVAVSLHHKYGSKELLSMMYDLGFTESYTEVLWFRSSVAKYTGEKHLEYENL